MFTGFASENTPAIRVWDFFVPSASASAINSISLTDDCAPIQLFRTGATTTDINVFFPSSPIEGKTITIVNQNYGDNAQKINIKTPDASGSGSQFNTYVVGQGGYSIFVYSKQCISKGATAGFQSDTGWLCLTQSSRAASNYEGVLVGGSGNNARGPIASVVGGQLNNATGQESGVFAGNSGTSSGTCSFVGGGTTNTASVTNAAIVGGSGNIANNLRAFVGGGQSNTASSSNAAVVGGSSNTASGQNSIVAGSSASQSTNSGSAVLGGTNHLSNGSNSSVICGQLGTARLIAANLVLSANIPVTGNVGVSQAANLILARETTDATATRLLSNTAASGTTNQVILPNNSAYYVKGSIIATVTGGGNTKSWDFIATIKRGANAAATSIVGAVTLNVQAADAGASTWIVAITADTTNGGLAVTVTGQAATTIRWVAKLESTEVTY
jgi:hypothetical protein